MVVHKDLTKLQADSLVRDIMWEFPTAKVELIPQGNDLWTVRYEIGASGGGATPAFVAPQPAARAVSPPAAAAAVRNQLADDFRAAGAHVGVDPTLLAAIAWIESRWKPDAKSATSSAEGLFQFLSSTWHDLVRKYGTQEGISAGAIRVPRAQCVLGAYFLRDNSNNLKNKIGTDPTGPQCYLAHFLGLSAAVAVLRAAPADPIINPLRSVYATTPAGAGYADNVLAANSGLLTHGDGTSRSVQAVLAILESKVAEGLKAAGQLLSANAAAQVVNDEPSWLVIARQEIGVKEIDGAGSNPRILEYFSATSYGDPEGDHVAWCGAFVSFCLHGANAIKGEGEGKGEGKGSARAADWIEMAKKLGMVKLDNPRVGCVVVLKPAPGANNSSGHVGFFLSESNGKINILGGNQSNSVMEKEFPAEMVRAYVWPDPKKT